MTRYYSNIVGKYGIPVQNALKKLAGLPLAYICSTLTARFGIATSTRSWACTTA